jgi:hypothetical protein
MRISKTLSLSFRSHIASFSPLLCLSLLKCQPTTSTESIYSAIPGLLTTPQSKQCLQARVFASLISTIMQELPPVQGLETFVCDKW